MDTNGGFKCMAYSKNINGNKSFTFTLPNLTISWQI